MSKMETEKGDVAYCFGVIYALGFGAVAVSTHFIADESLSASLAAAHSTCWNRRRVIIFLFGWWWWWLGGWCSR